MLLLNFLIVPTCILLSVFFLFNNFYTIHLQNPLFHNGQVSLAEFYDLQYQMPLQGLKILPIHKHSYLLLLIFYSPIVAKFVECFLLKPNWFGKNMLSWSRYLSNLLHISFSNILLKTWQDRDRSVIRKFFPIIHFKYWSNKSNFEIIRNRASKKWLIIIISSLMV